MTFEMEVLQQILSELKKTNELLTQLQVTKEVKPNENTIGRSEQRTDKRKRGDAK